MQPIKCLSKKDFYWRLKRNLKVGQSFIIDGSTHEKLSVNEGYSNLQSTVLFSDKPVPLSEVNTATSMSTSAKNVNLAIKKISHDFFVYTIVEVS